VAVADQDTAVVIGFSSPSTSAKMFTETPFNFLLKTIFAQKITDNGGF